MVYNKRECEGCKKPFEYPKQRGRPPKKCPECRKPANNHTLNSAICRVCHENFTFERKRGRPPLACETCRNSNLKPRLRESVSKPAVAEAPTFEIPDGFKIGRKYRIVWPDFYGVPRNPRLGRLLGWDTDSKGTIAIMQLSNGTKRIARASMLEKI